MGYSTKFEGSLTFAETPTVPMLAALQEWFGKDLREVDPYYAKEHCLYYVDAKLTYNLLGIEWDRNEKNSFGPALVNWLIHRMQWEGFEDFGLRGKMMAQGEDAEDRWLLVCDENGARKIPTPPSGIAVTCPDCGHRFFPAEMAETPGGET